MNNTVELEKLSTTELKAFAYDHSALVNFHRNQVQMANNLIEKRVQEEVKEDQLTGIPVAKGAEGNDKVEDEKK